MFDIILHKIDESFMGVECEPGIAMELRDRFSFFAENYKYHPKYKAKFWDGKIVLYRNNNTINVGLLSYFPDFCKERNYTLKIDPRLTTINEFSREDAEKFIDTLGIPFKVRDYQIDAFVKAIRYKRKILLSSTGSGKSLILYLIVRYLQETKQKGLIVVPTVSLTQQMYKDFISYGYDSSKYCHIIYSGQTKDADKFLYISTFQSLVTIKKGKCLDSRYFQQFDFLIIDETHKASSVSLTNIINACTKAEYKIGVTGTLKDSTIHELTLVGLLGTIYRASSTVDLIEKKFLSPFSIKSLVLKHPEEICKLAKKWSYHDEINYLVTNTKRNDFIKNLALSLKGNTLVLFQLVTKQGKVLHKLIEDAADKERKIFFVFGGTDIKVRETVREITEKASNAIIIASYAVFSTGTNLRNLHNIIFASPSKSRIRNLQSIGRVLRLGDNKEKAVLFDIADDLRVGKHLNYTLQHYISRLQIYNDEGFEYKTYAIDIKY